MKTTAKNKSTKGDKPTKPNLKTEGPLAEKDEVKQAEANQQKKSGK